MSTIKKRDNEFQFWCPLEISKALDTEGKEVMRLGGIASTIDEDSDGEFLDPNGFDINPFIESGMVNWHHQAKGQPATIIGEPSLAEIRPDGFYIETDLYPSSGIARDVWELAQTLEKDSKTRRLGYSIEGKVIKRKSNDKKHPDYKKIVKAIITGVAITHQPKNPKTFANIIKGEVDDDFEDEVEEAIDTENAAALKKESVDKNIKNQTFSKSETIDRLFKDIPGINIEKAENIYLMLSTMAKNNGRKRITDDDISKAYEALGLTVEENEEITKGDNGDDSQNGGETTKEKVPVTKDSDKESEEAGSDDDAEKAKDNDLEKGGSIGSNRFDRLEKAIAASHINVKNLITATAVLIKDCSNKLDASAAREEQLTEIIKGQEDTIALLSEKMEQYGSSVPAPKSLSNSNPVDRVFSKGSEDELGNGGQAPVANQVSMSKQPVIVAELLDQACFEKGYDAEFGQAVTAFEATKKLPANIISRLKVEKGVNIVA